MKKSRIFKYIANTVTVASIFTLIACVLSLESNNGSWTPVWCSVLAFTLFAVTEWMKERERN